MDDKEGKDSLNFSNSGLKIIPLLTLALTFGFSWPGDSNFQLCPLLYILLVERKGHPVA